MKVVVVESPAKAKTINKYLGSDYTVVASYGHVRDLPAKDGSVRPDEGFAMDWETEGRSEKHIRDIAQAVRNANALYLATDPDREGEAISWHVAEILQQRKALKKDVDVKRVVFNEITKGAVLDAMRNPRGLDRPLIEAYLARRALDYLVGFTLSPVLWRKLPGARSAGRVQSVALRLVCEREAEIEAFKPREYWTIEVDFATAKGALFTTGLTHFDGRKLDKFAIADRATAEDWAAAIAKHAYAVDAVERRKARRHPQPPFTTSTLQQEASRKLGFSANRTMQLAQRLYEGVDLGGETVGLITYMRTDGVQISKEAVSAARRLIGDQYGAPYLPDVPRAYKTAAKNAQEAHEAIRPTDVFRRPEQVARFLDRDQLRLYELIWKRTVASQMESAVLDQMTVDVVSDHRKIVLRATGSVVVFDGFLTLYQEGQDDPEDEEQSRRLPDLDKGERLDRRAVRPDQHFTQPPPRYTEASLVKRMEELGIGRPSTYASILTVLQERDYVRLEKKRFVPEDRGRLVTAFLTSFFERYVQYNFTADLENKLDEISAGNLDWKRVLAEFWDAFSKAVDGTKDLTIGQVLVELDRELGAHFFRDDGTGRDPRACPSCQAGRLSLKLGKFGAFIGCSNYPECRYTRPLAAEAGGEAEAAAPGEGPRELGIDAKTGLPVTLRKGPYGTYVQLGEGNGKEKPKRVSLPKGMSPADVDLDRAVRLLALPRDIGAHPETKEPITAGIGRFGPYLKIGSIYRSLPAGEDILTVDLNRAVDLLAEAGTNAKKGRGIETLRTVGDHPKDGKPVALKKGRFGPYLEWGSVRATLPKSTDPAAVTLDEAVDFLAKKAGKSGKPSARGTAKAKAAPKKAAPKARKGAKTVRAAANSD